MQTVDREHFIAYIDGMLLLKRLIGVQYVVVSGEPRIFVKTGRNPLTWAYMWYLVFRGKAGRVVVDGQKAFAFFPLDKTEFISILSANDQVRDAANDN
jgi:hypothetical protein